MISYRMYLIVLVVGLRVFYSMILSRNNSNGLLNRMIVSR